MLLITHNLIPALCICIYFGSVYANTEIINFTSFPSTGEDIETRALGMTWHKIDAQSGTCQFELALAPYGTPWFDVCRAVGCKHELFVVIKMERHLNGRDVSQKEMPRYSLRISWPTSIPSEFDIELYSPAELCSFLHSRTSNHSEVCRLPHRQSQTRTMYARIRARDAGVRVPSERGWHLFPPLINSPANPPTVYFHLILDPLLLGLIPQSVVPTIWMILVTVMVGLLVSQRLIRFLEAVAMQVNRNFVGALDERKEV